MLKRIRYATPADSFAGRTERRGDCLIWTGARTSKGYGRISIGGGAMIMAHRYAWERVNGPIAPGRQIDHHVCRNHSCVNVSHLRVATGAQNQRNRSGGNSGAASGVRNVYRHRNSWQVKIHKGRTYNFGCYPTLEEAAEVAEAKRLELFGEFAGKG